MGPGQGLCSCKHGLSLDPEGVGGRVALMVATEARALSRFNDEVKHIKVVEKDSWIHITEAKKFESLLVRDSMASAERGRRAQASHRSPTEGEGPPAPHFLQTRFAEHPPQLDWGPLPRGE